MHDPGAFCSAISAVPPIFYSLFGVWLLVMISWAVFTFYVNRDVALTITKVLIIIPFVKLLDCVSTGLFIADCPWYGKEAPEIPYLNIPRTLVIAMAGAIVNMMIFTISIGWGVSFFQGMKSLIASLVIGVCFFLFGLVYFLVSGSSAVNDFIEIIMLLFYSIVTVLCIYKFREVMQTL